MIYSSAILHRVKGLNLTDEEMAEKLKAFEFVACRPYEESKSGWISPFGEHSDYLNPGAMGGVMICLKVENRKIPAGVINEIVADKLAALKRDNPLAKFNGAFKRQLKEDVRTELQPRAFSKTEKIHAYLDKETSSLVINTSSISKAESFVATLKFALNSSGGTNVKIIRVKTTHEPSTAMTGWLINNTTPSKIKLLQAATIRDTSEGNGNIKYSKQDLNDKRLVEYLEDKKTVQNLSVDYDNAAAITITEDFVLKSIKWNTEVFDESSSDNQDSVEGAISGDFLILRKNLNEILKYLIESCFGGEEAILDDDI